MAPNNGPIHATRAFVGLPIPRLSRAAAVALSLVVLAAVALGDYLTAWYYLFDFFYLVPLLVTTLYVGRNAGLVMSLVCAIAWTIAIALQEHPLIRHAPSPSVVVWSWNFVMRMLLQSSFVWLVAQLVDDACRQRKLATELQDALDHVSQLRALIPICAWCKKIRDDAGYWQQIDRYFHERELATFTHGICPDCERRMMGD